MTERIIDLAQAALGDGAQDPARLQAFINEFCQREFWVTAQVKDRVGGKDLVGFSFNQLEGIDLPVLMLYCHKEDGLRHAGEEDALRAFPGVIFLSMAGKTRFHGALIDGDDSHTIDHDRLLLMLRLLDLEGGSAPPATLPEQDPSLFQRAVPHVFTRAIYDYCRKSPDIIQCRIGIASSPGQSLTLPDFLVMLEGTNLDLHREGIATLARQHLPVNQLLMMLDPEPGSGNEIQYASLLKTLPPFYGKSHGQDWWSRLKRRFNPPQVPWIQAEIVKE